MKKDMNMDTHVHGQTQIKKDKIKDTHRIMLSPTIWFQSFHEMSGTGVINFQSIQGKTAEMAKCIEMDDPDIIVGTETWLKDSFNSSEIFPSHYYSLS